jgi:hypothetical protein
MGRACSSIGEEEKNKEEEEEKKIVYRLLV